MSGEASPGDPGKAARSVLFLTVFLDLLGYGVVIPLLPEHARGMGAGAGVIGLLIASYSLMQFVASPVLGGLSDRFGRRPLLLLSIAVNALSYVVFAVAGNLAVLFAARLIGGLAAGNLAVAQAYLSDVTPPERRSRAFGMIGAATGLGFVFGPPLGGLVTSQFGVSGVGWAVAGLCLLNLALAFARLPETRAADGEARARPFAPEAVSLVRTSPVLSRLFAAGFLFTAGFAVLTVVGALLWIDRFGLSHAEVGYAFGLVGVVMAGAQAFVGKLAARFGDRAVLAAGLLLMTVALAAMPAAPPSLFFPLEVLAIVAFAAGYAFALPTGTALAADAVGAGPQGQVLGQYQAVGALARIAGPLIGGAAYGVAQGAPFLIGAGLIGAALLVALRLPPVAGEAEGGERRIMIGPAPAFRRSCREASSFGLVRKGSTVHLRFS